MMKRKYKQPSDYPQFAFRLSENDKKELIEQIDEVHKVANKDIGADEFKITKNRIILMALQEGLKIVKKTKKWGTPGRKYYGVNKGT